MRVGGWLNPTGVPGMIETAPGNLFIPSSLERQQYTNNSGSDEHILPFEVFQVCTVQYCFKEYGAYVSDPNINVLSHRLGHKRKT